MSKKKFIILTDIYVHLNNIKKFRPHLKGNTARLHDNDQLVNAVWGYNHCLFWESY
jgi:hypothetical protein